MEIFNCNRLIDMDFELQGIFLMHELFRMTSCRSDARGNFAVGV